MWASRMPSRLSSPAAVALLSRAADGSLRVKVQGTQMRHYPDTDTIEVDGVTINAYGPDGRVTTASSLMLQGATPGPASTS